MKIELTGTKFEPIQVREIRDTEKHLGVLFPNEYVDFLLHQNGGYPL